MFLYFQAVDCLLINMLYCPHFGFCHWVIYCVVMEEWFWTTIVLISPHIELVKIYILNFFFIKAHLV